MYNNEGMAGTADTLILYAFKYSVDFKQKKTEFSKSRQVKVWQRKQS